MKQKKHCYITNLEMVEVQSLPRMIPWIILYILASYFPRFAQIVNETEKALLFGFYKIFLNEIRIRSQVTFQDLHK